MSTEFDRLVSIVAKLRAPDGCPWDREQTHRSIVDGLLDEAYEFLEALDECDDGMMREELGDILLQVVFHAQIASEEKRFTAEDVAKEISDKLIRRHPHVFGDDVVSGSGEVVRNWEAIKKTEKAERESALDGIPPKLPALFRAEKLQKRAARTGFDWKEIGPVLDKVEEEFREFREALDKGESPERVASELGDIMFSLVNVARHHGICAEDALRMSCNSFDKRFRHVENSIKESGREIKNVSLEEMDKYWNEGKTLS